VGLVGQRCESTGCQGLGRHRTVRSTEIRKPTVREATAVGVEDHESSRVRDHLLSTQRSLPQGVQERRGNRGSADSTEKESSIQGSAVVYAHWPASVCNARRRNESLWVRSAIKSRMV